MENTLKSELEQAGIPNITKTNHGTEYAYEKEGKFDTEFIANCVEYGEEFYSEFYAPLSYTKEQLRDIGMDIAMAYGGELISIERPLGKNSKGNIEIVEVC